MLATHARQARTWACLGLGQLGEMHEIIPEAARDEVRPMIHPMSGSGCWTRTSDPAVNSRLLYQLS